MVAREYGLEPIDVIEMAVHLQRRERETNQELLEARRAAREYTGLTMQKIGQLEDAGKDETVIVGLDVKARELAHLYPALGIGQGYTSETGYDGMNEAARLWDLLRTPDPVVRAQHDETLVREAAELVYESREVVPF